MVDHSFRVMGCAARIVVIGGDEQALVASALDRLEELEGRWSRFRADSEVGGLNRSSGEPAPVSDDTTDLVERSIEEWRRTAGLFDPTLLDALVEAGYDRSHEQLPTASAEPARVDPRRSARSSSRLQADARSPEGIVVDRAAGTVTLPRGVRFDPGGIGKGLAADIVTAELLEAGAARTLIDLGGDIRLANASGVTVERWVVIADDPFSPGRDLLTFALTDGGVATSSQLRRRWRTASGVAHHLLDPRTREPSTSSVASATVIAADTTRAEVTAKAALLAGVDDGAQLILDQGAVGALVLLDGTLVDVGELSRHLGELDPRGLYQPDPLAAANVVMDPDGLEPMVLSVTSPRDGAR